MSSVSGIISRLRHRLESAPQPISIESLGCELFHTRSAPREMLIRQMTSLLEQLPEAHLRSDGLVEWKPLAVCDPLLQEARYVVVDVETTGSSTRTSRVTEIALYAIEQGAIIGEFSSLVNPQMLIPELITSLTGITNAMVAGAPRFGDLADRVSGFIGDRVIVAHNASFDFAFLNMEFTNWETDRMLDNPTLCTVHLSRHLVPGLDNYKLHTVAEHFGVDIINRHRAAGDALATAKVFLRLLGILEDSGVNTLSAARHLKKTAKRHL